MDRTAIVRGPIREDQVIHCEGPEGETLFWDLNARLLRDRDVDLEIGMDEMWRHYHGITDHRLLVLVGALCVETRIDGLLRSFIPGYELLRKGADFTFSMKIKIARAMRLIPSRILASCDLVRRVRNEFVHSLELNSFSQLNTKLLDELAPRVRAFNSAARDGANFMSLFDDLVSYCLCALISYACQLESLREYLETEGFRRDFMEYTRHAG